MKFYYFDTKIWRGEVARMLFHLSNIEVEDVIVQRNELDELVRKGISPNKELPVLEVDGKLLTQAAAIAKYVASQTEFSPKDEFLRAKIDEIFHMVDQSTSLFTRVFSISDSDKRNAEITKVVEIILPSLYDSLDKLANQRNYMVGYSLTVADLVVYSLITSKVIPWFPHDLIEKYQNLKRVVDKVSNDERIVQYNKK